MTNPQNDEAHASAEAGTPAAGIFVPRVAIGAFFTSPEIAAVIEDAAGDRRMSRAHVSVKPGGIAAATALYHETPPPSLIIVESRAEQRALFAELEALAEECLPDTKVIVIGHANDVALFRELLQHGVSDYLVAPLAPLSLIAAVSRIYRHTAEQRLGRVTAFIGARGGAGSSTVAHNVASSMASLFDTDVLLADLDLPFGTVGLDFNLDPVHGMVDILHGADRVDEVLLDRLAAKPTKGLQILAATSALEKAYDLKESDLERLLEIAQTAARHLVLDLPQTWTSWVKKTLQSADEIVITATPDLGSMRNAKHLAEFLRHSRPNDVPPRLVLNQVGVPKRPEIKPADFAAAVGLEPNICIPFDAQLFGTASNDGRMIVETAGKMQVARAFENLGRTIAGQRDLQNSRKSARSLFGRLMGRR
ncbi:MULTISPECIES: AAA family ATPase [unclassified Mesorhizobium]|uniref:AAA family ATPase n=1 Tax=unclassified Mesorhizobium TaxID=325217 RepID=UPI000FD7B373|nr:MULTISPECIES: AAA family ATPase [unclassified Mesorhizobium]TGQ31063.1 CtpF protein [Mesorhizobium sp. M00.F.Ca.ET.216.01.1.1]TIS55701.1 MAG: CtpF protein [Mesorhizobium sp.]TIS86796.1 MAG: CtpF protein [Mesorhizobium sp.]TJW04594.1 MAG: CtpF protein [Mesorhizobium sp.]TJW47917.1 MAG: CtpF protein [Mesorhizobium sp.]